MRHAIVVLGAVLVAVASKGNAAEDTPSPAPAFARWGLSVAATLGAGSLRSDETRTLERYLEDATADTRYSSAGGAGADLALRYRFTPHWGLRLAGRFASRPTSLDTTARVPHPLYLDRPRDAEGRREDATHRELGGDLSLTATRAVGPLECTLLAGPSVLRLEADLFQDLDLDEVYPFDETAVREIEVDTARRMAFGVHAGVQIEYPLRPRLALAAQVRYTRLTAAFEREDDEPTRLKAGGLNVGAGLRFWF